ncbi:hypothetical protein [Nocardia acidivorans]|uniref:hypothetical protein n=1 Tax=Nocardia acidivorans TaxID=404580 RepID=UPI00083714C1|nr:hypothetical protein [Nocardia acidivorans]
MPDSEERSSAAYLLRRLPQAVITVFVLITLAFGLGRLTGSPAATDVVGTGGIGPVDEGAAYPHRG